MNGTCETCHAPCVPDKQAGTQFSMECGFCGEPFDTLCWEVVLCADCRNRYPEYAFRRQYSNEPPKVRPPMLNLKPPQPLEPHMAAIQSACRSAVRVPKAKPGNHQHHAGDWTFRIIVLNWLAGNKWRNPLNPSAQWGEGKLRNPMAWREYHDARVHWIEVTPEQHRRIHARQQEWAF